MLLVSLLVIFIAIYALERRLFINALLLGFILVGILFMTVFNVNLLINEEFLATTYSMLLVFLAIPALFFLLSIFTFFNGKILLEKEGKKLRNLLLPALGTSILLFMTLYIWFLTSAASMSAANEILVLYCMLIFFYFMFIYTSFAVYLILYNVTPIFSQPDFIIVLGSGLIGDRVPPLLASRLNKAADEYEKYNKKPLIITSGGQGSDELVSESYAMRGYLLKERGIDPAHVLMEDKSVNTLENMAFSKRIMDRIKPHASAIFVTNEFHLFRASLYARKAKIKGNGVGSRTALFYIPNAFSREFIALLVMYKWFHFAVLSVITIVTLFLLRAYW